MSETPDNGTEEEMISEDLLALLYPEDDAPAGVTPMGDVNELEDLRSLRALFREMPEEEPSDAVSNKLLAMAAQNAPKKEEESKGFFLWLSDLLLPAAYHPGLAAAASLVLVAGLGLTLYVNGKSQVAEPVVASQSEAPEMRPASDFGDLPAAAEEPAPAAAPSPVATDTLQAEVVDEEERRDGPAEGAKQNESYFGLDGNNKTPARLGDGQGGVLGGVRGGSASGPGANIAESKSTRKRPTEPAKSAPDKPTTTKKPKLRAGKGGGGSGKLGEATTTSLDDLSKTAKESKDIDTRSTGKGKEPSQDPAPKPPPPPPQDPAAEPVVDRSVDKKAPPVVTEESEAGDDDDDDDAADSGAGEDLKADEKPDPRTEAASLHQEAINAAKKGNCNLVKKLGQRIRKLSSVYYDRSFLSDKKLKACLAPAAKKKK